MPEYMVALKDRKEIADGTMAFYFEKPENFNFKAGQYIDYTLIDPPHTDDEGNMRTFSIANSPHQDYLMLASRMRPTAFKNSLKVIPIGTKVRAEGPFGSFTLHKNESKAAVFLAGGIGITPFKSMIEWATHEKLPHRIYLFFSNKTKESAPFLEDLEVFQKENPNFKLIATLTDETKEGWPHEKGIINAEMINKYLPKEEMDNAIFYIAGPEGMVKAMRDLVVSIKVDEDNIRSEEFSGY